MPPQDFPSVIELLKRKGIWLEKRKSQHFLRNQVICADIAELAGLTRDHLAIEVGAGLGNLTVELAARAGRVIAVEMDPEFADWHSYLAAKWSNLSFVSSDFLQLDLGELLRDSGSLKLCGIGNLPYQITSEILFRFVDAPMTFDSLVFMIQKEVAERIAAGPGNRAAGALTYKIALRYEATIEMIVGPEHFVPPPKVTSAVIVLRPLDEPLYRDAQHRDHIHRTLDRLFMFRRKTILNGLRGSGLAHDRDHAVRVLGDCSLDENRRPETLSLKEVISLTDALHHE
ncbi:ribosomal RNA small subunit methyltransferase A [Candidatus Sumerlaeota bacterium]|nr:ribosomal RNA small subunit methyltransferase A [Candidatus Sumerlaeota bacterium]